MGWSQELSDFSEGFSAGSKMVESRGDRELKKLEAEERKQRIRRGEIELDPAFIEREKQEQEAKIASEKAGTALTTEQANEAAYKNTPAYRAAEEAERQATIDAQDAAASLNRANAKIAEAQTAPERLKAQDEKLAAETALAEANARQTNAAAALDEAKVTPERLKAADAAAAEELAGAGATRAKTEAETKTIELENLEKENFMKILEGKTRDVEGRAGLPEVYDPNQAVETDDTPDPDAEETPGPTSAVEVPEAEGVTTSTYSPPDTGAEEARPLVDRPESEADSGGGMGMDVRGGQPEEAVSTEAPPVTSRGKSNREVSTTEAGPRAHPHVDEQQDRMAKTRKQPLDASTVNVLEYAGANTGINAVVYSGGQAHKGEKGPRTGSTRHDGGLAADVKLYDSKTGRMLDMRNPDDAKRMRDFGMYAVQAGATGIGAGEGYMGNNSMHIGFGHEASWGGAPWIQDALEQGKATRDKMTSMPGGSDVTKMFQDGSIHKSAKNAALAGMKYAIGSHGLDQDSAVNTPENDDAAYSFMSGDFGADAEQVEEVENTVQNIAKEAGFEINESETPMYALAAVYEAYLAVGKPEEAEKAASALMGHYKKLFGQYGAVAKAAASQGDIDGAVEAAAKAYANVPDGYDVQFNALEDGRYEVVMTNQETKEVTHRQIATPQEIGGLIMEVNPGHFEQLMSQAAGMTEKEGTLSEAFIAQHPEKAGMTLGEAKESRLIGGGTDEDTGVSTGGGKGKSAGTAGIVEIDTPEKRAEVATQVKDSLTKFIGNITETGTTDETDVSRLNPEANSDMLMYIRPVMEEVAVQNYGKVAPDLVVEAIVNMSEQAPTAAKILPDDQTIEVTVEGSPPIKMQKELYYRLADARSRYGGTGQAVYDQTLRELRRTTAPGILPDYDPTRYPVGEVVGGEAVPTAAAPSGSRARPQTSVSPRYLGPVPEEAPSPPPPPPPPPRGSRGRSQYYYSPR